MMLQETTILAALLATACLAAPPPGGAWEDNDVLRFSPQSQELPIAQQWATFKMQYSKYAHLHLQKPLVRIQAT